MAITHPAVLKGRRFLTHRTENEVGEGGMGDEEEKGMEKEVVHLC